MQAIRDKVRLLWTGGHERSQQVKRNIIYTFVIRGLSVLIGFLLLPLTISYLNSLQYGLWVTIASLVAWINTFDIGLSNGLRNKLAHSLALNQQETIQRDVSTTYALLIFIAASVFLLFFSIGAFVDWNWLLKVPATANANLWTVLVITLASFCIQFILQPVNSILIATQQPFKVSLIALLGQALTYLLIWIIARVSHQNLYLLVLITSGAPVFVLLISNIYLFATSLRAFLPKLGNVYLKNAKSLLSISSAFFFIQIGALVLYETDNVVITRILGPEQVTVFNIPFKYFSAINIIFYIIITPYWSAFTDAYARSDLKWIRQSINKMRRLWLYTSAGALLMCFCAGWVYHIWIGQGIVVPLQLTIAMAIYTILQTWMLMHVYLLNGTGKLRLQLILVILTGIINIPLSIWLIGLLGVAGTVLANVIVIFVMSIFLTRQSSLIMNGKATGIWNR